MTIQKAFIKDTFVYGLGRGLKKLIGFFLLPFYTRALSVGEFGMLETLGTFSALLMGFFMLGLDSATGYYYFKASGKEKADVLSTNFYLRLLTTLLILPLFFLSGMISGKLLGASGYMHLVMLALGGVMINLFLSEQSHLFRYYRQPWRYNLVTIIKSLTNIGLGILLVIGLKKGVEGAMWARLGSSAVVVLFSFVVFNRRKYSFRFSLTWARKLLQYGFPLIWAGLAAWIYNSSDRFFLLHYHDLDEVGLYSIGAIFSQPVLLINMAVQMSFGVLFFQRYHGEKDTAKPESRKMANEIYQLYLAGSVLLATGLSVFADILVPWVTTPDYAEGARVVPFLTFSWIAAQSFQTMGPGISLAEKTWHFTWITGVTALLNVVLNFWLVPLWGFMGAGLATLISFVVYWQIKVWVAGRYFKVDYPFGRIFSFFALALGGSIVIGLWPGEAPLIARVGMFLLVTGFVFLFKLAKSDVYQKKVIP